MSADEPAVERIEVEFEVLLDLYLDGMLSGTLSTLGHLHPEIPGAVIDRLGRRILSGIPGDPLALEEIRQVIRRRLQGRINGETTTVRIFGAQP
ncbi:hypothetical protein [Nocardia brasiliensis]|uniref:hypothetical protein n=1 Tax=Nocardia brasiliensis TaxID=37326 RepID=UPI0033DAE637